MSPNFAITFSPTDVVGLLTLDGRPPSEATDADKLAIGQSVIDALVNGADALVVMPKPKQPHRSTS